ncbi:polymer-forming cytoskeletal protein [uncultured Erythrobacter sp.]|uniref:bactofilin family protein n=1 Tax=uncultured Erythrobacter sp. TaxID=263913 RepID=UPI0026293E04|nr:polymer-forming cytoskeletal protein [uncultured Erythrobacter sp.]
MANGNSTFSVIGSDVSITGDISASVDLHIDGKVEGDIKCASLVQGEASVIKGGITADTARMSGKVVGSITAKELVILKTAKIEGDVHYDALTIEQGAQVDGRFAPNSQKPAAAAPAAKPATSEGDPQLRMAN